MKTIIGFDSWTEGSTHFKRLVPAFKKCGYRLILIHIGSWGHDIGRPQEEAIGELCVRDISYYGTKSISEILEQENPSAVLFMSTRSLAHMAFNRYVRYKKIPTCHMYHGLVMVQAFGREETPYSVNYIQHLNLFINRIFKNIFKIIPFYINSILKTNYNYRDFLYCIETIIRRGIGVINKADPYIIDTTTDIGCVYVESDIDHMHRNYRIPLDKIYTVGNPDITIFGLSQDDIACSLNDYEFTKNIIYIDTALVEVGAVFDSSNDFIKHILDTKHLLNSLGYSLLVKLHPAHHRTDTQNILIEKGVNICDNPNFVSALKKSVAVITEPSTAAMIPSLMGIPILLAQYGKLKNQAYGHVLSSYPRARFLNELNNLPKILLEEKNTLSRFDVLNWIRINSGPMPAEEMPERAVEAISFLISKSNALSK